MKKLWIALAAAILMCLLATSAAAVRSGEYEYSVNSDGVTVTITGYIGEASGDLTIPGTIDGYTVTSIGKHAFEECTGFTGSLTIPDGVISIDNWAFSFCTGFTGSLTIPDSVTTIGKCAFQACTGFTGSLTIPDSVTAIGDSAFTECSGFTGSLTIPESVASIGENVFNYCSGITEIIVSSENEYYASLDGILYNKDMSCLIVAPGGMNIKDFQIPDTVTAIKAFAISYCEGFTGSITIPDSVASIGAGAFDGCSKISKAYFYGDVPAVWGEYPVFSNTAADFTIYYPAGNTSGWTSPEWTAPDGSVYKTATFVPENTVVPGDLSGDGILNSDDVLLLSRYFAGMGDRIDTAAADIDGNGKLTRRDAMILARAAAGWAGYTLPWTEPAA